jgi:hypothetical protein
MHDIVEDVGYTTLSGVLNMSAVTDSAGGVPQSRQESAEVAPVLL